MKNSNKTSLNSERESTLQSSNPVYPRERIRSIIVITSPMHSCLQKIIDFCHLRYLRWFCKTDCTLKLRGKFTPV